MIAQQPDQPAGARAAAFTHGNPPAADHYGAMNEVEWRLELVERPPQDAPSLGELVALVDSLCSGTLNESQAIWDGLLTLARKESA